MNVCSDLALGSRTTLKCLQFKLHYSLWHDHSCLWAEQSLLKQITLQHCSQRFNVIEAMSYRAQDLSWWMISTVSRDTLSHLSPQGRNNEQRDWRPCWPVPLWSMAERNGLWFQSWVWDTKEVGVLVESWVAGGILAACHAHLSVKVLSWVKALRREEAWRHSALTRVCSRLNREAHVYREEQTTRELETGGWVVRVAYSKRWHLSFYCDTKQMQYWNSRTHAGIHTNNSISLNQQM